MKTKKKAILGIAMAMIFSLAFMQGINQKSVQQQDRNLQQLGLGAAYASGETEGGVSTACAYVAATCGTLATGMAGFGVSTFYLSGTTPVGWGYWAVTGLIAL